MSYVTELNKLTLEQRKLIQRHLTLTPTKDFNDKKAAKAVDFFRINGKNIVLPYLFASGLFGIVPNMNNNFKSINIDFTGKLRDYQTPVCDDALKQLYEFGTTTLGLYPSFGKTICAAYIAVKLKILTVVLIKRLILAEQWVTTFESFTSAKVWFVGKKKPDEYDIIVMMDERWPKIDKNIRDQVGLLIIDEAHMFCTPGAVPALFAFQPKYIVIETATLERDDNLHQMIYAMAGEHGIFIENTKKFNVTKVLTNTKVQRYKLRDGKTDYNRLVNDTLFDKRRNNIIFNLVKFHLTYSILILTNRVDHVTLLYDQIKTFTTCDYMCGDKQTYTDSKVLIGTTHKIGTGFDQASACKDFKGEKFNLLILVCSIKKYQMLVQNVGRVLRSDEPNIYHFVDADTIFYNHWTLCNRWYRKRNANIKTVNINNKMIDMDKSIIFTL